LPRYRTDPEAGTHREGDAVVVGDPRTIGRYAIRSSLGSGGFATVYRAYDPVLDREVALKVLHPHLAEEPDTRDRFVREGRTLARIHHRNIVQVFDAGTAEGLVYLAMELVEGRSLAALLRDGGPLPAGQVVQIAEQIGSALDALHGRGLIHGDIKPANVLLDEGSGRAVLLDLGVARRLDDTVSTAGWIWGTPAYMAPEQIAPGRSISPRTDVYQFGATMYALLSGEPPFTGEPTQVMYAVVHHDPPNLAMRDPAISPPVAALVERAMAKDPAERPSTPGAFAGELRELTTDRTYAEAPTRRIAPPPPALDSGAAAPSAGPRRTELAPAALASAPTARLLPAAPEQTDRRPESSARSRSRLPLVIGGALAALVLAGAAGLAALGGGGNGDEPAAGSRTPLAGVALDQTRTATPTAAPSPTPGVAAPAPAATPAPTPPPSPAPSPEPTPTPEPTPARTATPRPTATPAPPPPAATAPPAPVLAEGIAGLLQQAMARYGHTPLGPVEPVPLDRNNVLYVQRGQGADGQRLFIALNDRFLGTDWEDASPMGVSNPQAIAPGQFVASYADGAGGVVPVVFTWNGGRLRPDRTAPGHCQPTTGC
jgi:eukaryotic-like serine/threonine-protein kinase